jgi:hypothetical protein
VPHDPHALPSGLLQFLTERHLATLTTLRADGNPHVVPVGITYDAPAGTARVITSGTSAKARHVRDGQSRVAVCQLKDPRAPQPSHARAGTLHEGHAVARYAARYRQPRENPARVVLEISVDRILGNA